MLSPAWCEMAEVLGRLARISDMLCDMVCILLQTMLILTYLLTICLYLPPAPIHRNPNWPQLRAELPYGRPKSSPLDV